MTDDPLANFPYVDAHIERVKAVLRTEAGERDRTGKPHDRELAARYRAEASAIDDDPSLAFDMPRLATHHAIAADAIAEARPAIEAERPSRGGKNSGKTRRQNSPTVINRIAAIKFVRMERQKRKGSSTNHLSEVLAERFGHSPDTWVRFIEHAEKKGWVRLQITA